MKRNAIIALSLFLAIAFLWSCSKTPAELPESYHKLAIKYSPLRSKKPIENFDRQDSILSYKIFSNSLRRFGESINIASIGSDEELAALLNLTAMRMEIEIIKHAYPLRDSLDISKIFIILWQFNITNHKALKEATVQDFLEAYQNYLPEYASAQKSSYQNGKDLFSLLNLSLSEPDQYGQMSPGEKAFAFIYSRILARKFNASLSEKQKILRGGKAVDFINSLSEEQVRDFSEFKKYSDLLD